MIIFTRGRRRTVDTSGHFCPDHDCSYHGWLGRGNIHANGHPGGQPWHQFQCVSCQGYFSETHGTIFHGKRSSVELIVRVIACLAEGLGIRGTARVFEIDPHTMLRWLVEAAVRIPVIPATQSGAKLPPHPKEACHPIRTKAAPHRSPIGAQRRLG